MGDRCTWTTPTRWGRWEKMGAEPRIISIFQGRTAALAAHWPKPWGGYGGLIWGEKHWIESLEQNSSICVGASPPPLVIAAASARALEIARAEPGPAHPPVAKRPACPRWPALSGLGTG